MLLTAEKQDFITGAQFFIGARVDDTRAIALDSNHTRAGPRSQAQFSDEFSSNAMLGNLYRHQLRFAQDCGKAAYGVFLFPSWRLGKSFLKRELRFRMELGESMTEQDCGRDDNEHLCGEQLPRRKDRGAEQEKNEHQDD